MNVCSRLVYPACKAHVFYAVLYLLVWPLWLYHIFPHYFKIGTTFIKSLLNIKSVYQFPLQFFSETILTLRIVPLDIIINVQKPSYKTPLILLWVGHPCCVFSYK